MVLSVRLDEDYVVNLRELKRLRDHIHETHKGLLESCGGCGSCEGERALTRRLEGVILYAVMQSLEPAQKEVPK